MNKEPKKVTIKLVDLILCTILLILIVSTIVTTIICVQLENEFESRIDNQQSIVEENDRNQSLQENSNKSK